MKADDKLFSALKTITENPRDVSMLAKELKREKNELQAELEDLETRGDVRFLSGYPVLDSVIFKNGGVEKTQHLLSQKRRSQREAAERLENEQRQAALQQWLKRPVLFAEPSVRCSCGETVGIGTAAFFCKGSSQYQPRPGLLPILGAVSCPSCAAEIYFGSFESEFGLEEIADQELLKGVKVFGVHVSETFSAQQANGFFSELWRKMGGTGELKFR